MKLYLAGPMSGIPKFNYPAFDAAATNLRSRGYDIVSPAEMDSDAVREASMQSSNGQFADLKATDETWGDFLSRDVKLVADEVDGVVLLPGWNTSRGARLEAFVCLSVQKPVFFFDEHTGLYRIPDEIIAETICTHVVKQGDTSRYESSNS